MGRRTDATMIHGVRKRIAFIAAALAVVLAVLIMRIYHIQIMCGDDYSRISKLQYLLEIKGLETRGQILDRNGRPISGERDAYYYFIEKEKIQKDGILERLLNQTGAEDVTQSSDIYKVYKTQYYDADLCKTLTLKYGAYALRIPERSTTPQVAGSLVGSLDEETGQAKSGLELIFDKELQGRETGLSLVADSAGNIIKGYGPIIDQSKGNDDIEAWEAYGPPECVKGGNIETSLDLEFQRKCENAIDNQPLKEGEEAVCIVTDAEMGEILVMAQKGSDEKENPAFERELSMGEMTGFFAFICALEKEIIKDDVKAQKYDDIVSGVVKKIGYETILEKCYKMGFGQRCMDIFTQEAKGHLPYAEEINEQNIGTLTARKNPIKVTPIQMAKAMTIIGRDGRDVDLKLLKVEGVNAESEVESRNYVLKKGVADKAANAFWGFPAAGFERMMQIFGVEKYFAWQSENDDGDYKNYWCAGQIESCTDEEDFSTGKNAGTTETTETAETSKRYTVMVVVRGDDECREIAENIFMKACS